MNIATFEAPTRWIVSGLELERGLILSNANANYRFIFSSVCAELLPTIRGKQTIISNLSDCDYIKCADVAIEVEDDRTDDGVDEAAKPNRRRLMDGSSKKNVEDGGRDLSYLLQMSIELRVALTGR